ncbi:MAG: DinB family protein [Weeksellaceae bacterium]
MKLTEDHYPRFFIPYLRLTENDILSELSQQLETYPKFIREIPEEKLLFRYAPGKWTIKEVVGHNTDTERIKAAVALRIARNDKTPNPGFKEDDYVMATDFNSRDIEDLLQEFIDVRKATISLYKNLSREELERTGFASDKGMNAETWFYFMVGHIRHHENIVRERYLSV